MQSLDPEIADTYRNSLPNTCFIKSMNQYEIPGFSIEKTEIFKRLQSQNQDQADQIKQMQQEIAEIQSQYALFSYSFKDKLLKFILEMFQDSDLSVSTIISMLGLQKAQIIYLLFHFKSGIYFNQLQQICPCLADAFEKLNGKQQREAFKFHQIQNNGFSCMIKQMHIHQNFLSEKITQELLVEIQEVQKCMLSLQNGKVLQKAQLTSEQVQKVNKILSQPELQDFKGHVYKALLIPDKARSWFSSAKFKQII